MGTAVIGSLLVAFFFGGVVDGLVRATNIQITPQERTALIVQLEDESNTLSPDEQMSLFNQLPPPAQQEFRQITERSMVEGQQDTLLIIAFLLVLGFLVASILPRSKDTSGSKQKVIEEAAEKTFPV